MTLLIISYLSSRLFLPFSSYALPRYFFLDAAFRLFAAERFAFTRYS